MLLKLILFPLLATTIKSQPKYLSDDELNKKYFYRGRYDRKIYKERDLYTYESEFISYCSNSNWFMDKIAFGLIFDNHNFMLKLTKDLAMNVGKSLDSLDQFFIDTTRQYGRIKPKTFMEYDAIWAQKLEDDYFNKSIDIRRSIDYLRNTLLDLYSINTLHGTATVVAADIYLDRYDRAARNFEELIIGTLILDIVNQTISSDIASKKPTEGLLKTITLLSEKDENMDLVTTILLSMFAVLLENDRTYSEEMLLLAERVKVAIKKFTSVGADDTRYSVMRRKFKFILIHLPEVIREFVWDVPRNQRNFYCIRNVKYNTLLYIDQDKRGDPILVTGRPPSNNLFPERFSINFQQEYLYYAIDNQLYRSLIERKRARLPYRKFYLIPSVDSYYIKTLRNDDERDAVFLRALGSGSSTPIELHHHPHNFEDMYEEFGSQVLWKISVCVS